MESRLIKEIQEMHEDSFTPLNTVVNYLFAKNQLSLGRSIDATAALTNVDYKTLKLCLDYLVGRKVIKHYTHPIGAFSADHDNFPIYDESVFEVVCNQRLKDLYQLCQQRMSSEVESVLKKDLTRVEFDVSQKLVFWVSGVLKPVKVTENEATLLKLLTSELATSNTYLPQLRSYLLKHFRNKDALDSTLKTTRKKLTSITLIDLVREEGKSESGYKLVLLNHKE